MVSQLNDAKSVGASGTSVQLKTNNAVIKGVYVTKANAGDIAYFLDGTTDGNGVTQFQVEADSGIAIPIINRTFTNGLRVVFGGTTARYVIVFE